MAKSFNIDLWQNLVQYSKDEKDFLNGAIFFGVAPENTPTPYCVMHVLDCGNEVGGQTLCQKEADYNAVGISDIQFSLYDTNDMAIDEILQYLNGVIKSFENLTEYRIISAVRQKTKNASSFTNETGKGFTEYIFKFERL